MGRRSLFAGLSLIFLLPCQAQIEWGPSVSVAATWYRPKCGSCTFSAHGDGVLFPQVRLAHPVSDTSATQIEWSVGLARRSIELSTRTGHVHPGPWRTEQYETLDLTVLKLGAHLRFRAEDNWFFVLGPQADVILTAVSTGQIDTLSEHTSPDDPRRGVWDRLDVRDTLFPVLFGIRFSMQHTLPIGTGSILFEGAIDHYFPDLLEDGHERTLHMIDFHFGVGWLFGRRASAKTPSDLN